MGATVAVWTSQCTSPVWQRQVYFSVYYFIGCQLRLQRDLAGKDEIEAAAKNTP